MLFQAPRTSASVLLLVLVGCCRSSDQQQQQQLQEPSGPVDASFINDLAKKPVKLDPKLRKALLKVLNRLEEEDKLSADATSSAAEPQQQQDPAQRQEQRQQELQFQEQTKQRKPEDLQRREHPIKQQQREERQNFGAPSAVLPTPAVQAFSSTVSAADPAAQLSPTPAEPAAAVNGTAAAASRPAAETTGTVVDFFEAPLLTAFTVQQDAAGVARRVIPIHVGPGQLERQKILELETRGAEGGDRNTVEPDKRELEFLKTVELAQLLGPQRQHGFAQQQQQQNEQIQQIQLQQSRESQRVRQNPQPFFQQPQPQLQPQDQVRLQILQPVQPIPLFQLQPAQRFAFGPFLQPEPQQQPQQQLRVLRQPQQQTFGYGLPRLPGDLDVVYKVLALNHEGRSNRLQGPARYNILLPGQPGSF